MKRRAGMICMILGAVLIGAALSLFLYNEWDSARAEERAEQVLEQMQKHKWGGNRKNRTGKCACRHG